MIIKLGIKVEKKFMQEAINQAKLAQAKGDYAVGAVLVQEDRIIAVSGNRSKRDESPLAHAEVLVINQACKKLNRRHLPDCILYVTHEPCPMCASLAVWAKVGGIVYGAKQTDMKEYQLANGNKNYLWRTIEIPCKEIINKSTENIDLVEEFMREKCLDLFHNL